MLKKELAVFKADPEVTQNNDFKVEAAHAKLFVLKTRCNDVESHSRRSNLVFFGLKDKGKETWAESKSLIVKLCADKTEIKLDPQTIDRSLRIGAYNENKNKKTIVVKFSFFKHKDQYWLQIISLKEASSPLVKIFLGPFSWQEKSWLNSLKPRTVYDKCFSLCLILKIKNVCKVAK